MGITIIDAFSKTASAYAEKRAIGDDEGALTYRELYEKVSSIGTYFGKKNSRGCPIAILMDRTRYLPAAMLGIITGGSFYTILDPESPPERIERILSVLDPAYIIYEPETEGILSELNTTAKAVLFSEICSFSSDNELLKTIKSGLTSESPAYALFTSGSTGTPKGVLLTHSNVISYIKWFTRCFDITSETVFGSQTPFYFSMSVSDFYSTIFTGASYEIIPKLHFSFPANLIAYMNEHRVNTIYWVPSALGIISKFDLLKYTEIEFLKKILFAGETMPVKYLNYLKGYMPDILYANLFGPTETTDICSYYIVNREFGNDESLPIGNHCSNCQLFTVDNELFVKGPFVAKGYYRDIINTEAAFVQNPLHSNYPDIVYRTGDLVRMNKYGEYEYAGRKDFQIKHLGYRVELGEIESILSSADPDVITICIYDSKEDALILAYESLTDKEDLLKAKASSSLPPYMQPSSYVRFTKFPVNQNGKLDRNTISSEIIKKRRLS